MFPSDAGNGFKLFILAILFVCVLTVFLLGVITKQLTVMDNIKTHCYIESLVAKEPFDKKACEDKFKNRIVWGDFQ